MSVTPSSSISTTRPVIYPLSYFAITDSPAKVIDGNERVRTLGEVLTILPQLPIAHPAEKHSNLLRQKFVSELMSHMDAYWDHFNDASLVRELFFRLQKRSDQLQIEENIVFNRLDILQAYIMSILFERVFLNSLARRQMFLDSRIKIGEVSATWQNLHRDHRILAAEEPSRWFREQFSHPFQFAIRRPHQIKMIDLLRFGTLQNKSLMWDSVALSRHQSLSMSQFFGKEWSAATMELQDALRRQQPGMILSRLRWVVELFAKSWDHSWQPNGEFQALVHDQIALRAAYFPDLYEDQGHYNPKLDSLINNEPQAIGEALLDHNFWQQIIVDAAKSTNHTSHQSIGQNPSHGSSATNFNQTNYPAPYQWLDRRPDTKALQTPLHDQVQREWHMQNNSGIHQAALRNAQFETALANPYGFSSKRLNSRHSLMETALQNQKQAESIAADHTLANQPDMERLQQVHIEICKLLAGVDYAASQHFKTPLATHQDAGLDSENWEITRIDKVKKSAAV